jgi:hypothetical protein
LGILKHGENSWTSILGDGEFEPSRTSNQVALKWQMIKIYMKGELDSINVKRQKLITEDVWIIAVIKKLQKRNDIESQIPVDITKSFISPYFRRISEKLADDAAKTPIVTSENGGKQGTDQADVSDNAAVFKIEKQIPLGKLIYDISLSPGSY